MSRLPIVGRRKSGDAARRAAAGAVEAAEAGKKAAELPPLGRPFIYLWGASGASNLGDGLLLIGAPLLAVSLTREPFLVSIVTAAVWLPWLLFALHAGAIADRYDRRRIMMVASWSRAAALGMALTWTAVGELSLPLLYVTVLVVGTAEVFSDTSAQSMLPMLVDKRRLGDANGRLMAVQTVANHFLGAPFAGVLVSLAAGAIFGAAGLCYALAGLLLLRISGRHRPQKVSEKTLRADIVAGLSYLWGHRLLRNLAMSAGLINLGNNAYFAVFVLWLVGPESEVGLTAAEYGLMAAALGVGAVAGSLVVERVTRRYGHAQVLLGGLLIMCAFMVLPILFPTPVAVFAAAVVLGACGAGVNVIVVSMRQRLVPSELLGRVNASYRLIGMGGIPVGALGGGVLGTFAGLPAVFYTGVGLCLVAAVVVARHVSARALRSAELAAEEAEAELTAQETEADQGVAHRAEAGFSDREAESENETR
ncbi:MFS transporter [Phytoactinopolyspora alkaliphila]|uniref:MFS transporter n=1 Tax=Phytoactinopolyspora alkaliphila TaxID=1783498 RepID=A0A6N9YPI2_9ACTN|nr:MFS transporter [Phytoactinopolyspora alkaliphila]NED96971.1 MFS transporter [Phytoactinopolyspora alkaliphila]